MLDQVISCEQDEYLHSSLKILPSHLYMQNPSNAIPLNSSHGVFEEVVPYIDHQLESMIHQQVAHVNYVPVNSQQHPVKFNYFRTSKVALNEILNVSYRYIYVSYIYAA